MTPPPSPNRHERDPHPGWQAGDRIKWKTFPTFSGAQVKSLWLTYRYGVYDLTLFADEHPGAVERLLLNCKGDHNIYGWWKQLGNHNVTDVHRMLETYRRCKMQNAEVAPILRRNPRGAQRHGLQLRALHCGDAHRRAEGALLHAQPLPLRAQPLRRAHVPRLGHENFDDEDEQDDDQDAERGVMLAYREILALPALTRDVYLQCGGHRRIEYNLFGNGKHRGVLLRDVLRHVGVDVDALYHDTRELHVWLIGADCAPDGERYGASIPLNKALDPRGDVLLVFEYNSEFILPDTRFHQAQGFDYRFSFLIYFSFFFF